MGKLSPRNGAAARETVRVRVAGVESASPAFLRSIVEELRRKVLDRIRENRQSITGIPRFTTSPARVLCGINIPFRVRHQPQHASRVITHSGHVGDRTIGIDGEWQRRVVGGGVVTTVSIAN